MQIVGENLGTVPFYVNEAMERHKILGMHVGIFGVNAAAEQALVTKSRQKPWPASILTTRRRSWVFGAAPTSKIGSSSGLDRRGASAAMNINTAQRSAKRSIAFLTPRGLLRDDAADPAAVLDAWLTVFSPRTMKSSY